MSDFRLGSGSGIVWWKMVWSLSDKCSCLLMDATGSGTEMKVIREGILMILCQVVVSASFLSFICLHLFLRPKWGPIRENVTPDGS
jgi:hypothetical protein